MANSTVLIPCRVLPCYSVLPCRMPIEQLLAAGNQASTIASDTWSMMCVYADLFPHGDRAGKLFDVYGGTLHEGFGRTRMPWAVLSVMGPNDSTHHDTQRLCMYISLCACADDAETHLPFPDLKAVVARVVERFFVQDGGMYQHLSDHLSEDLPDAVVDLMLRGLSRDPADRPAPAEMLEELKAAFAPAGEDEDGEEEDDDDDDDEERPQ